MRPLKCVYGVLPEGLADFFVMVDNVLRWGTGHFLESLVVRLGRWQETRRQRLKACSVGRIVPPVMGCQGVLNVNLMRSSPIWHN